MATAVLYVWGLKKSMTQEADLERILLNKCAGTVVKYLRKHGSITQKEMPSLIQGVRAGMFWSKNRIRVQEPAAFVPKLIRYMLEQQLLEEYDAGLPVEQIARRHGRTAGAIEARLSELGRRDQIQFNMR